MAHSEELARLRDAVVEAAKLHHRARDPHRLFRIGNSNRNADPLELMREDMDASTALFAAAEALLAAEALTCGKCKGGGRGPYNAGTFVIPYDGSPGYWSCPDCGGTGRKP